MINERLEKAINEQINAEMYSAYLYLSMSAYFEQENLSGFANWMRVQFQEEQFHAMKFFGYLNDRGGRVTLKAIDKPKLQWSSVEDVFEDTLAHERLVTDKINRLMDIAIDEKDHATASFLNWYVDEQVEEEATAEEILNRIRMVQGTGNGLFMMDREFASRTFEEE